MSKEFIIKLIGCDDTTAMLVSLNKSEAKILKFIANLSQEVSSYDCMPVVTIEKYKVNEMVESAKRNLEGERK